MFSSTPGLYSPDGSKPYPLTVVTAKNVHWGAITLLRATDVGIPGIGFVNERE